MRHTTLVDPAHRRFIEQAAGSPFSFFVVTGRGPGHHLALVQAAGPPPHLDGSAPKPGRVLRRPADQRRASMKRVRYTAPTIREIDSPIGSGIRPSSGAKR